MAKEENISFYLLFTSISSGSQTKQALLISARYARENTKPSTKSIEDLIPFNKIGNILGGFADASRKDKITKEILTVTMKFAQNELQEDFDVILKFLKEHPVVTLAKVINLSSSDVELIEKIREYTHYIATCIVESDLFDPKYPNSAIKTKTPEPPIISETPGEVVPTQTNDGKPVEKPEEPPGANEVESSSKDFDFSNPDTIKGDKDSITVDKNKDVNVITVKDKEVTVKGTSTKKPESEVYIQPTQENTKITIEGKSDKDFGEAEFGVKTSDKVKTTTIVVNSNKVPLNLFTENTKEAPSSINIEVPKDTTEISLKKVTISNGQLQINIPVSVTLASFVEAVFYSVTNFMVSSSGGADKALLLADNIKTQIDVVDLKGGSETTLNNAHVTKKLTINSNAFVKFIGPSSINGDVSIRFDEKVLLNGKEIISLDDASAYEGVPNSIKVERIGVPLDEYEEARLVCGKSFSVCNDWAAKITEFPANYSAAVCKDVDGRQCLVLEPQSDEGSKGGLAPGAIAGIVIAVIVVIVIVIVVVIIMRRKRGSSSSSKSVSSSSSS
ncbi:hypothetical protein TRFO_28528 [Tritrichomonas foetus]|uniref:Uncharacterized protein n=1 Tax=Tritrichomonas foetus TaxID=1144522 RepID=A0A1J4JZB4_9EUKA|nr:hypothetical protein TRFO_28528 [Tritrichomonas foetus]|eukprot:OHT04034.1 hypothetical protein TRFO_28528 [Tritrichomonas foetus]